jgi:predicted Rossmann fold flavoprotein
VYKPKQIRKTMLYDAIILGAGAAGLMCARVAAARGLAIALVDHAPQAGGKIPISGGGKANFTNKIMGKEYFYGADPSFCTYALERFSPSDMLHLLKGWGIAWEERTHGQLFCKESASQLTNHLVDDVRRNNAAFFFKRSILSCRPTPQAFVLETDHEILHARQVVLALGSPAWPQMGASDLGARLARSLGQKLSPFRPVLSPLLMPQGWSLQGLAGISLPVHICTGAQRFEDDLLITHQGISGPAALKASIAWQAGQPVFIDFMPQTSFSHLLDTPECGKLLARNLLCRYMPQRLAEALLPSELAQRKVAELSRVQRNVLHACVHAHSLSPCGSAGMKKAEACLGGVRTEGIDQYTMESLQREGLFIVGELLDITGLLGGYNLHWAWASGFVAGQSLRPSV